MAKPRYCDAGCGRTLVRRRTEGHETFARRRFCSSLCGSKTVNRRHAEHPHRVVDDPWRELSAIPEGIVFSDDLVATAIDSRRLPLPPATLVGRASC